MLAHLLQRLPAGIDADFHLLDDLGISDVERLRLHLPLSRGWGEGSDGVGGYTAKCGFINLF